MRDRRPGSARLDRAARAGALGRHMRLVGTPGPGKCLWYVPIVNLEHLGREPVGRQMGFRRAGVRRRPIRHVPAARLIKANGVEAATVVDNAKRGTARAR